ncbi:hypothetical protein PGTUg99_014114 [Puccinia graminis f. sp. tritici]|uniref:SigF-like NTF2-like domain-containing protein n=1 Tax=Puccinia graminis f. sp. tritici TaxID=56615 RepID=A0A5B0Q3S8_PUCGR|nr:hypothetical protein PGTUg99_014114 [Puccinia graminis f. sp. tritici]
MNLCEWKVIGLLNDERFRLLVPIVLLSLKSESGSGYSKRLSHKRDIRFYLAFFLMDEPKVEISDVIRETIQSDDPNVTIANLEKYFTEDAHLHFSIFKQPHVARGRQYLKGIYKLFRLVTINNKIEIHSVMFSQDGLLGAIECTQSGQLRLWSIKSTFKFSCILRLDLRKNRKGKYRIRRQRYDLSTEADGSRWPLPPGVGFVVDLLSCLMAWLMALLGQFLAHRGLLNL